MCPNHITRVCFFDVGGDGAHEGRGGDDLLEVGQKKYAGKIYVTLDNTGALAVVNAVPEDRLLAGLVPADAGAASP